MLLLGPSPLSQHRQNRPRTNSNKVAAPDARLIVAGVNNASILDPNDSGTPMSHKKFGIIIICRHGHGGSAADNQRVDEISTDLSAHPHITSSAHGAIREFQCTGFIKNHIKEALAKPP